MKKALSIIVAFMLILILASCSTEQTQESQAETDITKETTSETTRESETEATSVTTSEVTISDTTPSTVMTTETESVTTASDSTVPKADPTRKKPSTKDTTQNTTSSVTSTQDTDSTDVPTPDTSSVSVMMPDVMGMNYKEATHLLEKELQAAGFSKVIVSVGWAWGDGNPDKALTVMSQEPLAGTSIDVNDSSITVIIVVQEYGIE
ncbi:MAG: PASTA domain-containing protein [Clostridiales bacterium]|nr:PASTA domain-containing protein [Clostridiales bacterium]